MEEEKKNLVKREPLLKEDLTESEYQKAIDALEQKERVKANLNTLALSNPKDIDYTIF